MSLLALNCQGLHKSFGRFPAVVDVSLQVKAGEIMAMLGPSGCGKTTTLRLIAGFEDLDRGSIEIAGRQVADGPRGLPPEKRRIGMVFQDYAIFPHLSVAANVGFGLSRGQDARVTEMLAFVGLAGEGEKMPHELSGGQQQRVALARALAPEPALLLLDEPFSNLDAALRAAVRHEVRSLLKKSATTAIFVTHDQEEALFMGDQVAVLNRGRLEQVGAPEQVFHEPTNRFVADFLGQTDFIPGEATGQGVASALGQLPCGSSLPAGTPVELGVRVDDVVLLPAGSAGNATVIDRVFVGIAYIYHVQLADGSTVHSFQAHNLDFPVGTRLHASLRHGHKALCFAGGQRVI